MEAVLFVLSYPIVDWIVKKTAYQSLLQLLPFMRYITFKMYEAFEQKKFSHYFSVNIRSMDCNRDCNIRFTLIRYFVTVVMYRFEMASQRRKNQCHSSYRFLNKLIFSETTRWKNVRFRWIGILCGLHNNLKRMEAVLFVLAYPIENWIVKKTAYQTLLQSLLFARYSTFKMYKAFEQKNCLHYFSLNVRSMDCNRVVEVWGF